MNKSFLVPVLALVAFGLPMSASVVTYCNNASPSCTDTSGSFSSAGLLAVNFSSASIVSNSFTDPVSGAVFNDGFGGTLTNPSDTLADSKGAFQISLPANTLVFSLQVNSGANYSIYFYTDSGATYNHFSLTASGTAFFGATSDDAITDLNISGVFGDVMTISNFDLQGSGQSQTPEVGTLLLIGGGLIAMRWMKRLQRPRFFRTPQTA